MGYVSKDIAVITQPKQLTLSALPNFVKFESKPATKTYLEFNLEIKASVNNSEILITVPDGTVHSFKGTTDVEAVGGNTFFISTDFSDTAENLRQSLLSDSWINSNFEILIPFTWSADKPVNGKILNIKSKGAGDDYEILINTDNSIYAVTWVQQTSTNGDSISGEASTVEVDLDIFINPAVKIGQDDKPTDSAKLGSYITTLSKTYAGAPLWFDLNALFAQYPPFNIPPNVVGWFDPKTIQTFRFVAKIKSHNSYAFYQSNALFVLNGYGRPSDNLGLSEYIFKGDKVKLLTNKPRTPYVRGQKEFINFIAEYSEDTTLRVLYRAYSTAGDYLGKNYGQDLNNINNINTCVLNIDAILDIYPNAGVIKVALVKDKYLISNEVEYLIRPECLHKLNNFSFLNRLGGWDAFNFDAETQDEIKPESETYNKTVTPDFKRGDSIETNYITKLSNTLTIEGAPVNDEVAEWLKEFAASRVKLNKDGYYVIVEDFTLKKSANTSNFHTPILKYRLSETYTND